MASMGNDAMESDFRGLIIAILNFCLFMNQKCDCGLLIRYHKTTNAQEKNSDESPKSDDRLELAKPCP